MKHFLTLVAIFSITTTCAAEIQLQNPSINTQAPNFATVNSYGQTIQLSDLRGSPVILEWTNHECPYVARHYDENNMQDVQKIARAAGIIWLSIISSTPGDQGHVSAAKANALTNTRGASPAHVLLDDQVKLECYMGLNHTSYVYDDANGILRYKGAIDDMGRGMQFFNASFEEAVNYVSSQIGELVAGQVLAVNSTTAYGCSVKYNYD